MNKDHAEDTKLIVRHSTSVPVLDEFQDLRKLINDNFTKVLEAIKWNHISEKVLIEKLRFRYMMRHTKVS
ncbi:hypothetical protein RND71_021843 [Anisodus tanguticus]|uniref:DUF2470 domain-containing protein n=1 Tax=Anisodus tanguticus TaxID=243964 RepID=A0AAE1RYK1_9SOLA|nr:hypothetical protein RND71_021843 [Anisodus tanguticus]